MAAKVDPRIRAMAERVIKDGRNKRAIAVLKQLLEKGSITTDDLNDLGYNHPPRAVGDVRDEGIPIETGSAISKKTGRRMAVYTFGQASGIQQGRIGGRSALPKKFKQALIDHYGSIDCITGAILDHRVLQIDHRIPYRVAGDDGLEALDVKKYMLLDGSSQRAKSWSCEHCQNFIKLRESSRCATCFWASPEHYKHVAMEDYRRVDLAWQGQDVAIYDKLKAEADKAMIPIAEFIKRLIRQRGNAS